MSERMNIALLWITGSALIGDLVFILLLVMNIGL